MTTSTPTRVRELAALLRREHECLADFLLSLAAFDRDRGWADLGHASLWSFLHRELGLSATAAFQRKVAVDLLQRFPSVEGPLRDGRLCMSSLAHLARVLEAGNEAEVLPRFFRLSAREARELVAEILPRSFVPLRDMVTAVVGPGAGSGASPTSETEPAGSQRTAPAEGPPGRPRAGGDAAAGSGDRSAGGDAAPPPATGAVASSEAAVTGGPATAVEPPPGAASPPMADASRPGPPDGVDPLDGELRRLHITVSRSFLAKVEELRMVRSHARPGATTAELLEEAVDHMLAKANGRRPGSPRSRRCARPASSGHIPAHVRAYVVERDGGSCRWPLEGGGVCGSKLRLEVDHIVPRARGGPSTPGNLRLLCGFHNAEWARRCFGEAWMARFAQKETGHRPENGPAPPPPGGRVPPRRTPAQ